MTESLADLGKELTEQAVGYPFGRRAEGSVEDRAMTYGVLELIIIADIIEGTTVATPQDVAMYVHGITTDKEAKEWAEKNSLGYSDLNTMAEFALDQGNRDLAKQMIWSGSNSQMLKNEVLWDMAVGVFSLGVAGAAGNVIRAGSTLGWKTLFTGGVRESGRNVVVGAYASRVAGATARAAAVKIPAAMIEANIGADFLIATTVTGAPWNRMVVAATVQAAIRSGVIKAGWSVTAGATAMFGYSMYDNIVNAAENAASDLELLYGDEFVALQNQLQANADAIANEPSFIKEMESVWGDPGRWQTNPEVQATELKRRWFGDASQQSGMMSILQNGVPVVDGNGKEVTLQITGDMTLDEVQTVIANAQTLGTDLDDPLIGVPPGGFDAQTTLYARTYDEVRARQGGDIFNADKALMNQQSNEMALVPATYKESSVTSVLDSMNPVDLEMFQQRAIAAGLINPMSPQFHLSSRGPETIQAMNTTMWHANNVGRSWDSMVEILATDWQTKLAAQAKEDAEANRRIYSPNPYRSLDPAYAAQRVKDVMRRELGREPNATDLAQMGGYLRSEHRAAYEEKERILRADFAAEGRAIEYKTEWDAVSGMAIDFENRFNEEFEDRYAAELDRKKLTEETAVKRGDLMASFRLGQNI